ncbi:alkaline phosphatase D family protein [Chitinophagales bacterium]|nr:alkaline phosphatase D family protein [Chitinophagales bacterium]
MNKKQVLLILCILFITISFAQESRATLKAGQAPFFHGVASGDPLSDQVMLWTKVTPPAGNVNSIQVFWQVATDVDFTNIINFGNTTADASSDYTVKLDVCGLQPSTHYYYLFHALGQNSVTGRTKTAPAIGGTEARFAVASCSSYEHGYFNAYESMSKRNDLDAVIHLGDYIYEYEAGGYSSSVITGAGRVNQPSTEIITLTDYRIRHSHYKLDNQLQRVHQVHPFITTWDDHETANDSYKDGAQNHSSGTEGQWTTRKISGTQAYKEYMPIRNPDANDDVKIWRNLRYGNLLDLIVLDSRLWGRDEQDLGEADNSNHKLLGNDQFSWLENQLADNTTDWKIICQQVMMAPLEIFGTAVNSDQWDGYSAQRDRLVDYIENNNIENPVVLTGDIHTAWVNNVPGNASTSAAVEFVVTSVTSPGLDFLNSLGGLITTFNPHIQYVNLQEHGYMVLTVDQNKAQGDYVWLNIESLDSTETAGPSYFTNNGTSNMTSTASAVSPITGGAPVPPLNADQNLPFALLLDTFEIDVIENQFISECLISAINPCPSLTTTIIGAASYGTANLNQLCFDYQGITNYYGIDFFTATVCQTANLSDCDTIVVQLNVQATANIDTAAYQINIDSTLSDCIVFGDLVGSADSITISSIGIGTFSLDTNNCFVYIPDSTFNGINYIGLTACDSLGICDTLILQIAVAGTNNTTFVQLYGESEELLSNCLGFDDLQGGIANSTLINSGSNNALIFGDTCISYSSLVGFEGIDTLVFYACDNSVPPICDTIVYWITITTDTIQDTTGIQEISNTDFTIIGVYPNPFDVEILVQYYQFSEEIMTIALYDISGKQVHKEQIKNKTEGLKYARLETSELAAGNYILTMSSNRFTYSKKVVKP